MAKKAQAADDLVTLAESETLALWHDKGEGIVVAVFHDNGVTVGIDQEDFAEFASTVAAAAKKFAGG